ncbi:MAG: RNA-binding S4 domain-containing protein [Brevinemataceae bacterium]
MRLDKWLKTALIFKQRSKAVQTIDNNKITINNAPAKASYNVKIGDKIIISSSLGEYIYTVLKLSEKNVTKEQAKEMYELTAPEQTGTESEKFIKTIEKQQKKQNKKEWKHIFDDKKKLRVLRSKKYQ